MVDVGGEDTFVYTLGGRELVFRKIQQAQVIMLERYVDSLRVKADEMSDAQDLDGVIGIGKKINKAIWSAVESQFTSPSDLEWVQLEIITAKLDEKDLLPLLSNGVKVSPPDDDAEPAPAVKRPGRKDAAKKAAPRKTANPSRAKK